MWLEVEASELKQAALLLRHVKDKSLPRGVTTSFTVPPGNLFPELQPSKAWPCALRGWCAAPRRRIRRGAAQEGGRALGSVGLSMGPSDSKLDDPLPLMKSTFSRRFLFRDRAAQHAPQR